ncbi:glycosyl hydrolase family 8 [Occallatibacter riparius]|uniref:cellulase n=1 Tax=Occallatibacter riparius TaxID=1002689 RepID=A0A9J7BVM1_9BACT|nr:glycosyl hydrolase family 8 [Occallatibacter riparius]UWZ86585.1 glycosyl hydrolase family 8 [Occallatibacter riparius]
MSVSRRFVLAATLALVAVLVPALRAQAPDAKGHGAFATGKYRNLFAEAGHSQKEIQAKIDAAYQQLFHGDPQTQSIGFAAGKNADGPLMYVTDWNNHDVRTEGMSYGMMIAVQLDKKSDFDAIWNWAKTYMYISDPKAPSYQYFAWSCKYDGAHNSEGAAPDGESYFAMALLFAANRWGNGQGIYNYQAEADKLLSAMVHRAVISAPSKFGTHTVGPMMNANPPEILFVPDISPQMFTDPSYHLPAFYELWARWGPKEDRAFWVKAAETSRKFFPKTVNAQTGLAPVYANFDGTPHKNGFVQSNEFGYDAWRTASNWSVDWSWWRKEPVEQELSDRIQAFFEGQGIDKYGPVYSLDGKDMGATPGLTHEDHPAGLVGTNAVAGLAATNEERARKFTDALWNTSIPDGRGRYYDGMLYLMSMMHVSGNFRIWAPK